FRLDQIPQRTPVAAHGDEQHREVLHRPRKYHTGQNPEHAGQITHLRRQHWPDQGASPCNGGKMVPEEHVFISWYVVQTIVMTPRWRHAGRVQLKDLASNETAVITIGN